MVLLMGLTRSSVEVRLIPVINLHFSWNRCTLDISSTYMFPRIGVSIKLASVSVARTRSIQIISNVCNIWHCIIHVNFPQFLIFQENNSAQTLMLIFFTSRHYYFFEKLKIVEKQLCKLNCSYGKVSIPLKGPFQSGSDLLLLD